MDVDRNGRSLELLLVRAGWRLLPGLRGPDEHLNAIRPHVLGLLQGLVSGDVRSEDHALTIAVTRLSGRRELGRVLAPVLPLEQDAAHEASERRGNPSP